MAGTSFSRGSLGMVRVAAVSPELRVADVAFNTSKIIEAISDAGSQTSGSQTSGSQTSGSQTSGSQTSTAQIVVFPELCITGYTCSDLFHQALLLEAALRALGDIAAAATGVVAVVGLPVAMDGRVFNCAAVLAGGRVLGLVPKTHLPTYSEFYEQRWFASSAHASRHEIAFNGATVPFGADLLFEARNAPGCVIGVEICEDLWAVNPPSGDLALRGATVLVNPSASPELLGKVGYRRDLVKQQSARCLAAYVYAGSGPGESSTDLVFAGHSLICENGTLLAETGRFSFGTQAAVADIDVQRLQHERWNNGTFGEGLRAPVAGRRVEFDLPGAEADPGSARRPVARMPFVPGDPTLRAAHCREIFNIQATGLAKRLAHTGVKHVTIGISGGLDSTLALLVAIRAFDTLGLPRAGVHAVTMPGFGTTDRTYRNALALMAALGVTAREIPIRDAVLQHFMDIGHDPDTHDVTYENAQARERTQILMDVANKIGGFVVGTGDLSELALGWLTFNGDHMSMYHVNAGVPKTLVRYLIEWCADEEFGDPVSAVLRDVAVTPITPELLPLKAGELQQKTEETVGPYVLHDFFLYYAVRYGFPPRKVFWLARQAFGAGDGARYDEATVLKWLGVFYSRFFSQQFKRSAMPDGPKVGTVALSPRGDWRMPSDASAAAWRAELASLGAA